MHSRLSAPAEFDIELPVFSLGYRCDYDNALGDWAALREIDDRDALLVRPDRDVAWRSQTRPEQALREAVRHALTWNRPAPGQHDGEVDPGVQPQAAVPATN